MFQFNRTIKKLNHIPLVSTNYQKKFLTDNCTYIGYQLTILHKDKTMKRLSKEEPLPLISIISPGSAQHIPILLYKGKKI